MSSYSDYDSMTDDVEIRPVPVCATTDHIILPNGRLGRKATRAEIKARSAWERAKVQERWIRETRQEVEEAAAAGVRVDWEGVRYWAKFYEDGAEDIPADAVATGWRSRSVRDVPGEFYV